MRIYKYAKRTLICLISVITLYVGVSGTYSLASDPTQFSSWSDAYIRKMLNVMFVGIAIIVVPPQIVKIGITSLRKKVSGKNIKCRHEIVAEGLCDMDLGKYVVYDWSVNKCIKKNASGCKLISIPDFDLSECHQLCE